jgi:hypothetical protein
LNLTKKPASAGFFVRSNLPGYLLPCVVSGIITLLSFTGGVVMMLLLSAIGGLTTGILSAKPIVAVSEAALLLSPILHASTSNRIVKEDIIEATFFIEAFLKKYNRITVKNRP